MSRAVRVEGFRFKVWPIAAVIGIVLAILALSQIAAPILQHFAGLPDRPQMPWTRLTYEHTAQLIFALIAIAICKIFIRADYGLHGPRDNSYVRAAVLWGAFFGVAMTAVDFWPQILAHKPPDDNPYPLTPLNIAGWLGYEGLYAGPTDEVLFRGLAVTFLTATLPGRIGLGRHEMNIAGVIAALIFAFAYIGSFIGGRYLLGTGQFVCAFALGILYAYWLEKSKSLLAPILGHGVGGAVKFVLIFAMVAAFSGPP